MLKCIIIVCNGCSSLSQFTIYNSLACWRPNFLLRNMLWRKNYHILNVGSKSIIFFSFERTKIFTKRFSNFNSQCNTSLNSYNLNNFFWIFLKVIRNIFMNRNQFPSVEFFVLCERKKNYCNRTTRRARHASFSCKAKKSRATFSFTRIEPTTRRKWFTNFNEPKGYRYQKKKKIQNESNSMLLKHVRALTTINDERLLQPVVYNHDERTGNIKCRFSSWRDGNKIKSQIENEIKSNAFWRIRYKV